MFIAHGHRLRKYAPWILAGVLVLLLPGFVLLFTPSGSGNRRDRSGLPRIGGKPVNAAEFQQAQNAVLAQLVINTGRTPPRSREFNEQLKQEAVARMLLQRKAHEMGIVITDEDLVQQIRSQTIFHNDKAQFDPELYRRYIIFLNNFGISEPQFESIMREQLAVSRLRALVSSAAKVTPNQVTLAYSPLHEKTTIEYVEFDSADNTDVIEVTDAEAQKFFDQNPEVFRQPAQVKVRYVTFTKADAEKSIQLSEEEVAEYYELNKSKYVDAENKPKPLDEVKAEVRKELLDLRATRLAGDRATEFSVKLVHEPGQARPDFAEIAQEFGATPQETGFFDLRAPVTGIPAGTQFNQAAFALGPDIPFSDPVSGEGSYYVLEYLDGKPSAVPPFEEVKAQVIDRVKRQRAYEATLKKGGEMLEKVKQLVAAGKSFTDACTELGLKVQTPEPFTLAANTPTLPAASNLKEAALGMATNSISAFIPTSKGGLFFHLVSRQEPDPEQFAKDKEQFAEQLREQNRQALFQDWLGALMRQERVEFDQPALPAEVPQTEGEAAPATTPPSPS